MKSFLEKANQWANEIEEKQKENLSMIIYQPWTSVDGHTTHLTTADQWGNVVSLTQTIGPNMGSKVTQKDLVLHRVLGGYLGDYKPGDRANSHISPTIIERQESYWH